MVTAFLSRKAMAEYLSDISWETAVWVVEDATHLVILTENIFCRLIVKMTIFVSLNDGNRSYALRPNNSVFLTIIESFN
jgi:BsuBI/PstI restriction endonuclease domain